MYVDLDLTFIFTQFAPRRCLSDCLCHRMHSLEDLAYTTSMQYTTLHMGSSVQYTTINFIAVHYTLLHYSTHGPIIAVDIELICL